MTDIVEMLRAGEPCWEAGDRCKVMDAASGCCCAMAADEITALRAEVARLREVLAKSEKDATSIALEAQKLCLQNIQMKFALGYPMPADLEKYVLPENPFKCGMCDARAALAEQEKADE